MDEDELGDPLTQACPNACGEPGIETCKAGTFIGCTAPVVKELCDNNIDDDCDSEIDEGDCKIIKPAVTGADVVFLSSTGWAENIIQDNGDGTYQTGLRDLANPNQSGNVHADAYFAKSGNMAFSIAAMPAAIVEVVNMRDKLFVDNAVTKLAVQVTDAFGRPVKSGSLVTAEFSGLGLVVADNTVSCSTGADGRCILNWSAPESVFVAGGALTSTVLVGSLPAIVKNLTVIKKPAELNIDTPGAGMELPRSPRFTGDTFKVPCYLNSNGKEVGSYDFHLSFDAAKLQATAVTVGGCAAFEIPVSNLSGDANDTGSLKFNAKNIALGTECATGAKIHSTLPPIP